MTATSADIYMLAGAALFCIGFFGVIANAHLLRKILALNVTGGGVFLVLVAAAHDPNGLPDPVPHALVLTGIVVAVSATALALILAGRTLEAGDGQP
jgi:multicomponent Na+:H+ antiporter subunit C